MAGTLFGIGLNQWFDPNGKPLAGAKFFVYEANTSTPVTAYRNYALSLAHPWPIEANANGIIPAFWLADGAYRARLTDASQSLILFDEAFIQAIGPSSGEAGGGDTVDPNSLPQTGDIMWQPRDGTRPGWVRANGLTIGSASSGASERANADCQALFVDLWNTYDDTLCPVAGGRGANANADWTSNKQIGTLDMRGIVALGLDTMGNSAASVVAGATAAGGELGTETKTIAQSNLPNVTLNGTALAAGKHKHTYTWRKQNFQAGSTGSGNFGRNTGNDETDEAPNHTHDVEVPLGGSGTPLSIVQPSRAGTWYLRL